MGEKLSLMVRYWNSVVFVVIIGGFGLTPNHTDFTGHLKTPVRGAHKTTE